MRAVAGFLAINLWLAAVGWGVLRALGLLSRGGWRTVLPALGPSFLIGVATVAPLLCISLVAGTSLTVLSVLAVGSLVLAAASALAWWLRGDVIWRLGGEPATPAAAQAAGAGAASGDAGRVGVARWLRAGPGVLTAAYLTYGVYAFARAPTRGDDARIWSLRGLTLIYYHRLTPEIFLNPGQSGAHPVYPLLQPVVETILSEAMGAPQLRMYHAELWLLVIAAVCSAAFLIDRRGAGRRTGAGSRVWLAVLALLALTPMFINNVYVGDADITAASMLALATLGFGLWLESGERVYLAFATILLAAAASTKDEEFLVAIPLLLVLATMRVARRRAPARADRHGSARSRLRSGLRRLDWLLSAACFALLVLPWRVWLAAHHLTDSVQPPLPRALSPSFIVDQHRLHLVLGAMLAETLQQWGWLAAIFLGACAACLVTRTAARVTTFYLAVSAASVLALVWLYVATPLSLGFLIPTSMDRTVGVFMVPAAVATAHLLAAQLAPLAPPRRRADAPPLAVRGSEHKSAVSQVSEGSA